MLDQLPSTFNVIDFMQPIYTIYLGFFNSWPRLIKEGDNIRQQPLRNNK
jgi:hypothetical protein